MDNCGIYKIVNSKNGNRYIGSSKSISSRWSAHRCSLRSGKHHNRHLQASWNLYGEESFIFEFVEGCAEGNLLSREQSYINELVPEYNIAQEAGKPAPPPNKPIKSTNIRTGEIIVFQTRDEAAAAGFNEGSITSCCLGLSLTHKGYRFEFVDGSTPECVSYRRQTPVRRVCLSTGEIKVFDSMVSAAEATPDTNVSCISECCKGVISSHCNYTWHYINPKSNRASSNKRVFKTSLIAGGTSSDPIDRIEFGTGQIKSYSSCRMVKSDGFSPDKVFQCCIGKRNQHGGFAWKFSHTELSQELLKRIVDDRPRTINRPVNRVSMKNESDIFIYRNVSDVVADGYSIGNVIQCCNGQRASHKGYFWEYADAPVIRNQSRIIGTSMSDGYELVFDSVTATATSGFLPGKVSLCCVGHRKSHKGFTWRRM